MKTTAYICDICKTSVGASDLSKLSVKAEGITIKGADRFRAYEIDICKSCLTQKGFIVEPAEDQATDEVAGRNRMTLEDKLLDILEDMGVAFQE